MAVIEVTSSWTELTTSGATTDTLVRIGKDMRITVGATDGKTFSTATPIPFGQIIIVPSGVVLSAITREGTSYPAWVEAGFS
jgi:hypothetical protein